MMHYPAHQSDHETTCEGCHLYRYYQEGFFVEGKFWCSMLCFERAHLTDKEWAQRSNLGNQCYDR